MKYAAGTSKAAVRKSTEKHEASAPSTSSSHADQMVLEPKIGCIASALRVIGQKWTALIIRDLCSGPKRFGELEKSVGNINPRTLTQRLEALEAYGVVTKETFAEVPPRTVYTLTDKGRDLIPILRSMAAWGNKHHEEC